MQREFSCHFVFYNSTIIIIIIFFFYAHWYFIPRGLEINKV